MFVWACCLLLGCAQTNASMDDNLPNIGIVDGSDSITVLSKLEAEVPSNCKYLSYIQVFDGVVGDDPYHYVGTRERALQRLRNRAVELGADMIRIDQEIESLEAGKRGHMVGFNATAYKCVPSAAKSRIVQPRDGA